MLNKTTATSQVLCYFHSLSLSFLPFLHKSNSNEVIDGVGWSCFCSAHMIIISDCHLYPAQSPYSWELSEARLSKHTLSTVQPLALLELKVRRRWMTTGILHRHTFDFCNGFLFFIHDKITSLTFICASHWFWWCVSTSQWPLWPLLSVKWSFKEIQKL